MKKKLPASSTKSVSVRQPERLRLFGLNQIQLLALLLLVSCVATAFSLANVIMFTSQNVQLQQHIEQLDAALRATSQSLVEKASETNGTKPAAGKTLQPVVR